MTQRTITAKPPFAGTVPQFSQRSDEPENTNSPNNHQLLPMTHPLQQSLPPTPRTTARHSPQSTQSTQSIQPIFQPTTLSQRHHRLSFMPTLLSGAMHLNSQQHRTNGTLPTTHRQPPFWQHQPASVPFQVPCTLILLIAAAASGCRGQVGQVPGTFLSTVVRNHVPFFNSSALMAPFRTHITSRLFGGTRPASACIPVPSTQLPCTVGAGTRTRTFRSHDLNQEKHAKMAFSAAAG